jgi:D-beta-D-heptose 7-phosphate kinase/D-beta-D-heptose 1-phosphate adenosyltransferase
MNIMKKTKLTYTAIIDQFRNKHILVIGDFILDIYLKGTSTRLSPEAPVPVVDIAERSSFPGGAANTVCNLKALGAQVTYCSVIGDDREGDEAIQLLESMNVRTDSIIRDAGRSTISKTRIVSGAHVITRLDKGTEEEPDEKTTAQLAEIIASKYDRYDAVIISDYDKGVVSPGLLNTIRKLQRKHHRFLVVDSKRLPFFQGLRPSLVKPNYDEAIKLAGLTYQCTGRAEQAKQLIPLLFEKTKAGMLALTLDTEGSLVAQNEQEIHRCFAPAVAFPHVSGAGDTYLSTFTLSHISSGDSGISGEIATAAAAIAVKKESTSSCSNTELKAWFDLNNKYISSTEELKELCNRYHAEGKRVIFTNGCFDILHSGHVTYLHRVKKLGDVLIAGINTDESIKRLKGKNRPINPLSDRLQVLAGLSSVDHVVSFGDRTDDTPIPLIKIVRPHIFAKGGDYTKEKLPEASVVEALGGEIVFLPHIPDHSTTAIINRINLTKKENTSTTVITV